MNDSDTAISISAEELRIAADELAACGKRLRYSSSCFASYISELNETGALQHELVSRLKRQNDILESDIVKTEMMASVLARVADEADLTENAILDHEDSLVRAEQKVEARDLSRVVELVNEAIRKI